MTKRLMVLALALACSDPVAPVPVVPDPTLAAGTYSLVSVNGTPLPVEVAGGNLASSVVTVNADQTFSEQSVVSSFYGGVIGHASGKVVYRSTGFVFWANSDSTQTMFSSGTLSGDQLSVTFYGQNRSYVRAP